MTTRGNYNSGNDYVLEFAGAEYRFNGADFMGRVHSAAQLTGLLEGPLTGDDADELVRALNDLVDTVVNGEPPDPATSQLGDHLIDHWADLNPEGPGDRRLAHWLRRLVYRQAWIDQRIMEGELAPKAVPVVIGEGDQAHPGISFEYVETDTDRQLDLADVPDFSEHVFRYLPPRQ